MSESEQIMRIHAIRTGLMHVKRSYVFGRGGVRLLRLLSPAPAGGT